MRKVIGNKPMWLGATDLRIYFGFFSFPQVRLDTERSKEMRMECSVGAWCCCCFALSLSSFHRVYPVVLGQSKAWGRLRGPDGKKTLRSVWASFLSSLQSNDSTHFLYSYSIVSCTYLFCCLFRSFLRSFIFLSYFFDALFSHLLHRPFYSKSSPSLFLFLRIPHSL